MVLYIHYLFLGFHCCQISIQRQLPKLSKQLHMYGKPMQCSNQNLFPDSHTASLGEKVMLLLSFARALSIMARFYFPNFLEVKPVLFVIFFRSPRILHLYLECLICSKCLVKVLQAVRWLDRPSSNVRVKGQK